MNIERALQIEGWMDEHDLIWLAEKASRYSTICEIGSWQGRSTRALADNTTGMIWAIDHWNGSKEHRTHNWEDRDWCYKSFQNNLSDHISSARVIPQRMHSLKAANFFSKSSVRFQMVFIDASHDYKSIKADILAWKPLCTHLLCGHDAGHPPVMKATEELLPNVYNENSMWVYEIANL